MRLTGELRREQILDVTKSIVDDRGFHAVSIDGVARAAGISRPVVYEHFESLPGLLDALVRREGARALGQLDAVLPSAWLAGHPREQLADALRAYLIAVREDPATWRLVLMPPEGAPAVLREQIAAGRDSVVARLADAVTRGFATGHESPDPELTARVMSAVADECARLLLTDQERYSIKRLVSHVEWLVEQLEPQRA